MSEPRLVVMTYNIRHGRGLDDRVDLGRIAAVIAEARPDVVTLQEVDVDRARSRSVDQAEQLARRLGMTPYFAPCLTTGGGHYGIATLCRAPVLDVRRVALPVGHRRRHSEPRCALGTLIAWPGGPIEVINTHLSVLPGERPDQVAHLVDDLAEIAHDVVLGGDFNITRNSALHRNLLRRLRDSGARGRTWPSRWPLLRLDHLLYRGALAVQHSAVIDTPAARLASDHLPVVAAFQPRREAARGLG
jgi:endonuclease/exonuclease/phosphatase family metal-dependent hydrolase